MNGSPGAATGRIGEGTARLYLEQAGLALVAANVRYRFGEIDLIMREGQTYVFVEVKTRRYASDQSAYDAVSPKKQSAVCRCALMYMRENGLLDKPARFDVVIITGADEQAQIRHIKNAFEFRRGKYFV